MLIRLSYASQIATGYGRADIDGIVAAVNVANRERDITGVLAFDGKRILQILEGPASAVEPLFAHIRVDRRHVGIVELNWVSIERRMFPDWGMTTRPIADVLALTI